MTKKSCSDVGAGLKPAPTKFNLGSLKYDPAGLIPAIIQDYKTGVVLMLGYMNKESLRRTLKQGRTCFWSRSRKEYWTKGLTSGHFQFVKSVAYDCDLDTLLIKVRQVGGACHTGNRSCFYRKI
ncbi:MAG: phosphoribosyl-AMP cyclohydrolase [Candidatus Omnitrophota bacterium]|nr:phosphoribosyl-AMP cyclohydrolase [Candidatus Omnitrophota bacterium]